MYTLTDITLTHTSYGTQHFFKWAKFARVAGPLKDLRWYFCLQMLISFGAEFPCVDAMVSRAGPHHYDCDLARLHYYKAISSEAYLLATPDPFESAFDAGRKVKHFEDNQLHSMNNEYRNINRNLDRFSSKLLMKVNGTEEIRLLLCGSEGDVVKERGVRLKNSKHDLASILPRRVQDAIELDYKQVR